MVKFRLTKRAQKKLDIKKSNDDIEIEAFMTWHVNDFKDSRRTGLIFMNDLTRYSVTVFGLKKADFGNLGEIFKKQLKNNLFNLGIDELCVERYINELDSFVIDDSNDRSILGSITDHLKILPNYAEGGDTESSEFVNLLNNALNMLSIRTLKKSDFEPFPDNAMIEVLNAR